MANEKGPKDVEKIKGWESTSYQDGLADTLIQPNLELVWDTEAILKNLRENPKYVKIEENAEMMWYGWKKVHINLPAVWKFKWFKFDYFVSDGHVKKSDFIKKPELKEKSYSKKDVSRLLQAMNQYMLELQWDSDRNIDYENELNMWENNNKCRCNAWYCLKTITWLDYCYWLSDWYGSTRFGWDCSGGCCGFRYSDFYDNIAGLFLRLSD